MVICISAPCTERMCPRALKLVTAAKELPAAAKGRKREEGNNAFVGAVKAEAQAGLRGVTHRAGR